jgi:carbonic anhydrase
MMHPERGRRADAPLLDRRGFLKLSTCAAATAAFAGSLPAGLARADALTQKQRDAMTPDDIIAALKRGNERFRAGERHPRNYLREQRASATGQHPMLVLLSCIDSRAPAEVIMDLGIGEIFNCRVAGNIANEDILGSMEFACKLSGSKIALVMGHTACGAIKGAIDDAKLGNLTALLAKIRPAVEATEFDGERSAKNPAFVDAVARKNVELTMGVIRERSPILREMEDRKTIDIVGSMYDIATAKVDFFTT